MQDEANGVNVAALLTEDASLQCRCGFGNPCHRRATEEDFLCDWCRGRDHQTECNQMMIQRLGTDISRGLLSRSVFDDVRRMWVD